MSEMTAGGRAARRPVALPPLVVLLLGLLSTAVCLLLLFGPFYPEYGSPGSLLKVRLYPLVDEAPYVIRDLLWNRFFLVIMVLCGAILAFLPWRVAVSRASRRRSSEGSALADSAPAQADLSGMGFGTSTRIIRTERRTAFSFGEDGSITGEGTGPLMLQVSQLRVLARSAGIPWHTDFESEGGARAFLEILRAVHDGPAGVVRKERQQGATMAEPVEKPAQAETLPGGCTSNQPVPEPAGAAAAETGEDAETDEHRTSPSSWAPSYSGSVYTSTTLYTSSLPSRGSADPADPVEPAGPIETEVDR